MSKLTGRASLQDMLSQFTRYLLSVHQAHMHVVLLSIFFWALGFAASFCSDLFPLCLPAGPLESATCSSLTWAVAPSMCPC